MENMTVMETVDFAILVASFKEWHSFIWGCIGWAAALAMYYHHIKSRGKSWI